MGDAGDAVEVGVGVNRKFYVSCIDRKIDLPWKQENYNKQFLEKIPLNINMS